MVWTEECKLIVLEGLLPEADGEYREAVDAQSTLARSESRRAGQRPERRQPNARGGCKSGHLVAFQCAELQVGTRLVSRSLRV